MVGMKLEVSSWNFRQDPPLKMFIGTRHTGYNETNSAVEPLCAR